MISVIIPAYNSERTISRAVESVLAQTFSDYEIIVVDDGSTDRTGEVVNRYGDKVRYIYQENAGPGAARNKGLAAAAGEWVAFLDADDEWLPEKLRLQMELLSSKPDLRWCGCNFSRTDGTRTASVSTVKAITQELDNRNYFENYFVTVAKGICKISTIVLVIRREVFDEMGFFDTELLRGQDIDMWWRIAHRCPKIGYIAEPLAVVHLDTSDEVLNKRRLSTKSGELTCQLIGRHIELAKKADRLEAFLPFATKRVRKSLLTTIYNGYGQGARKLIRKFRDFFPRYQRAAVYILTVFPGLSSALFRIIAFFGHAFGFEKQLSRRWLYKSK